MGTNDSVNLQPVEISGLMRQIEATERGKIHSSVILNCVLGATSFFVETDPSLLKTVLTKFIDNAIRFTEKGSITFGYDVSDDELYFYVKDTGIGVPRNMQDELFEETDDNADSGLIRASKIVESLEGEIGVESRGAGKGSTFWFTIPNNPADVPEELAVKEIGFDEPLPDDDEEEYDEEEEEEDAFEDTQDLAHDITILIAEDNESNFLLFRSILESRYNIIHAYNGQEAVDLFQKYNVDLVLMDINMPLKDGYEATREIREVSPTVPIVAVTAYAFTTDKQRIFENGFNGYVSKPISINRLERVINDLLSL